MRELEIPDAAIDAADIFGGQILDGDLREQLDNAAPLIVAAALRQQAKSLRGMKALLSNVAMADVRQAALALEERADELNPEGGES